MHSRDTLGSWHALSGMASDGAGFTSGSEESDSEGPVLGTPGGSLGLGLGLGVGDEEDEDGDGDGDTGALQGHGRTYAAAMANQEELRRKGQERLLYVQPEECGPAPSAHGLGQGQGQGYARPGQPRTSEEVHQLALCYYMVAWHAYLQAWERWTFEGGQGSGAGARGQVKSRGSGQGNGKGKGRGKEPQPYAFPWTVAQAEVLQVIRGMKEGAQ